MTPMRTLYYFNVFVILYFVIIFLIVMIDMRQPLEFLYICTIIANEDAQRREGVSK